MGYGIDICERYIFDPPTHFLYKIIGVNTCINWFFYAPIMFLIYLYLPEDLDFIEESEFIVTLPRRIL